MEAVVIDAGSKLLKAGFAVPDQAPSMAVREQLVQLMFETFNISGFYASEQAVLSLYAVGRISGCTVDIGHGKIDIAPVIEGAVQHIASRRFEIGGIDLTKLLAQELDVEKIKELYSCCAEDDVAYKKTQQSCHEEQHTLPDGQVITIGRERYTVGEALFQPSILGLEAHGIVEQLNHRQLLETTVLCGGPVSMTGFEDRFQKEASLCSSAIRPSLVKAPEYMPENLTAYSAWVGGAILAKVVFPQNQHMTKADYDETGPSIVHRKCF
ncbi:Actin-related protein 7 [Camellia lanceoleosa]|uniref:Actin-related protein 7 n=1 Tax=Camellia lanceoleosa TaxID=1840588 RepID=A0ACC0ILN7_9ERIC|nr:Actin-related protein 7 [Camellia lanceoleosa]